MPVDAEAVSAAALACSSVAGMSGGPAGLTATYLPGRRVVGVKTSGSEVEVRVAARWGANLPLLGEEVRAAVTPFSQGKPVSVYIDDIEVPEAMPPLTTAGGGVG